MQNMFPLVLSPLFFRWECVSDDGQCPGLGGFKLGCPEEVPTNPESSTQVNPYGTCECDGQFFSNDDCTAGIFCDSFFGENMGQLAAVERPRGLGRWSLMREVQSLIPRWGYIPHVTAEMQWLGVTPPAVTSGKPTGEFAPHCKPRYRAVVPP